ncbi:MAG TPA: elongation factor 4, partial [Candidatus Hydrogenedentes bacterium]|nr:elongation factor 4 [Candidatus Hydrogenedentota bacterium]
TLATVNIGDTVTDALRPAGAPLPGYKEILPVVFCGMYPAGTTDIQELRDALDKLHLNDASFRYQADNSDALGLGFRLGFLGLLHMEIVQERLEREFDLTLVTTVPNVEYHAYMTDGQMRVVQSASQMPEPARIDRVEEPYIEVEIITPTEYLSPIIELCKKKRGLHVRVDYLDARRCLAVYQMPLAEIVLDFYDKLKTYSRGYASLEYHMIGYREGELVKLDILLNGEPVDALSTVVFRGSAEWIGRTLASKLRKLIPRQQFEVAIQAAIGNRILVRETVKALRKNVTAKCYGGDITRKRKLLEKQKEGKRRMKQVGSVEVPQEAFMALLQVGDEGR